MKTKRKLIMTTHTFYPNKDGVAVVNGYLTRGMVEKGYDVIVVTHVEANLPKEEYHDGVRILRVFKEDNPQEYIDCVKSLLTEVDTLVNVCTQTPTTDLFLDKLETIKCFRKILYMHGIYSFKWNVNDYSSVRKIMAKIYHNFIWNLYYQKNREYFKKYDVVTQLHLHDEGYIYFKTKMGIESFIIENAADDAFYSETDMQGILENYGLSDDYLLCVNNFDPRKNQDMLIKAYFMSNVGNDLVLIGSKKNHYYFNMVELANILQEKSNSNGINKRVIFLADTVLREHVPTIVKNARMYLLGSTLEMFPVSIVEAMAAGVPFVSTDVGVVKYFPGGKTVRVNDAKRMAQYIDEIIQNKELSERLSSEGRTYAKKRMRVADKVNDFEKICFGNMQ